MPSAKRPLSPACQRISDDFTLSMEISQRTWAGKSFEEMEQTCRAMMAPARKIDLKNPPRIP
jgi:hypothetical protein